MREVLQTKGAVNDVLRKGLLLFFIVIFLLTLMNSLQGYFAHHAYRMGDWLINYQGGMVRRGIIGELIYHVSAVTRINLGMLVVILHMFLYGLYFLYTYKLLKREESLLPFILLLLSPFILTFQVNDHLGGFRKEIIYFVFLSYVVWSSQMMEEKKFERMFYLVLIIISPIIILSHEMLALFIPYLLVVYLSSIKMDKRKYILLCFSLLPSVVSLIAAIYYSGTPQHAAEIYKSLSTYPISGGAIEYLGFTPAAAANQISRAYSVSHILATVPVIILSAIAFKPVYKRLKIITDHKLNLFLVLLSVIGTIALSFMALDWGRFIYIHLVSLFLLLFVKEDNKKMDTTEDYDQPLFISKTIIISIILYSTIWRIKHVGIAFSAFDIINPVAALIIVIFFLKYKLQSSTERIP